MWLQKFSPMKFHVHNTCMQGMIGSLVTKILSNELVFQQNSAKPLKFLGYTVASISPMA